MKMIRRWASWLELLIQIREAHTVILLYPFSTFEEVSWSPIDGFTGGTMWNLHVNMVEGLKK